MIDSDRAKLEAFTGELRGTGTRCVSLAADVRERQQVRDAVCQIAECIGAPDVLIPCAGICRASTVDDLKIFELEDVVRINFLGTVYMIEAVLPFMLRRGSGRIAGISSMAGVRGIPFEPAYSASKAALGAYLECLRCELRPRGITVTTVFPGYVQTPLLDGINRTMGADMANGNPVTPAAAAARILRALAKRHSYAYFPRPLGLSVRLSRLMPPRLYDRVMARMFRRFSISRPVSG